MAFALEARNLVKNFGELSAVDKVSFNIPEGAVFGLLGRNGAGKTTTIRLLMNIYFPDEGEVLLRGVNVGQEFRDKVGYLPEERGLYKKMKVLDTILFFAELKGVQGPQVKSKALEYLERFELLDRKDAKVEDLSKGNQQKIQFICTVIHDPEFIILDEPFSGLDPVNTNILKDIILELKKAGKIIIFSTHLMDFAEKMCDHIAIIHEGKIIEQGDLSELKRSYSQKNISLVYEGDIKFLESQSCVEKMEDFGRFTGIQVKEKEDVQTLLRLLVENNITVKRFDANDISLHEIFINLTADRSSPSSTIEQQEVDAVSTNSSESKQETLQNA
ncbi:ABC transporter ATP-binding protein [Aliikangiella coralliicola]|uniref:ATP-binding cassette domain-containing protein n=1 Tax=Aliikangiella coralliicola TaxID=2592383 RepID=A0A545UK07_9GAMM|nr:ATP-binding cassette domain-containing protein [Aliikangiella coralliicola]TQV89805.1 ATP-binding cassette domain-containing protein [Aliikangiella coralliicola]